MPQLPEIPDLPQVKRPSAQQDVTLSDVQQWSRVLVASLSRLWTNMAYTYNALLRVDTLANRTATPDLDESLFVTSDTNQLFAGVSGAWQNAGPRRGRTTVAEAATTAAVTLSPAENATTYSLSLTPSYNAGAVWYTAKATSGFTINVATAAPAGGGTVDWTLWRA